MLTHSSISELCKEHAACISQVEGSDSTSTWHQAYRPVCAPERLVRRYPVHEGVDRLENLLIEERNRVMYPPVQAHTRQPSCLARRDDSGAGASPLGRMSC